MSGRVTKDNFHTTKVKTTRRKDFNDIGKENVSEDVVAVTRIATVFHEGRCNR